METSHELDTVVTHLSRRHDHFRRSTIERLVARLAAEHADLPLQDQVSAVHDAAAEQLRYAEELAEG
jgi:hypothetical protein